MDTKKLAKEIEKKDRELNAWYARRSLGVTLPVTTSMDIRNSGFKIAVVDTNVFPSGFNNLCNNFTKNAAQALKSYLLKISKKIKKVLIVPENFTRNIFYFQHIHALEKMIQMAGFESTIGFLGELPHYPFKVSLPDNKEITLEKLENLKNFDIILLNNDCSDGIPDVLKNITQPIVPSPELGWHNRSKSHHFEIYCQLTSEFCDLVGIDHWLLCPITHCDRNVDVQNPVDLQRVAEHVDQVLHRTSEKYKMHGIREKPYAFVKNNAGTFGLGQIHVESGEELLNLKRKGKEKLKSSKGKNIATEFLIQEGVPTKDSLQGAPIEPVLYFIGGEPIGGFFRIHEKKDERSSLNAPGARFESLCFHKIEEHKPQDLHLQWEDHKDFFKIGRWLGKIATLAVGLEEKSLQSA